MPFWSDRADIIHEGLQPTNVSVAIVSNERLDIKVELKPVETTLVSVASLMNPICS